MFWLLSGVLTLGGFGLGAAISLASPAGTRPDHLWAWLRAQWSMQKPWLLVLVGAVLLLPATFVVRAIGNDWLERAFRGSHWFAMVLWFVLTVRFASGWSTAFREEAHALSLPPNGGRTMMMVVGWMTYCMAGIVGASAGALVILWSRAILG
ncbi:MAG TPA: hypothetical protein VHC70_08195 [Phycisphaerales bacterium]|nr:hypothetical protein [Phycisphaerales bacterium]